MLTGCGSAGNAPQNVIDDSTAQTVADNSTAQTSADECTSQTAAKDSTPGIAAYDYEPHIIDDNYRNYYEIFVASFYDSDGDKCGDLKGVEDKLDYITDLGCNGIWLMPVMSAPSYHKYDTDDYYKIDPAYGTNDDFKSLAEACDERGVKLIIDMVINHSSNEHPWFREACEYLRNLPDGAEPDTDVCPYVDYYHFSREKENASYCEVTGSDWYYEAVFYYTQPDLNLDNPAVVSELYDVADFWIDLGCDGFRMDAVMHFDETNLNSNVDFLHDYYEHCLTKDPDFYMVSEVWASGKDIASYYKSLTPSFFNFDVADSEGKLIKAGRGKLNAEKFVSACAEYPSTYGASNPDYIDAPFITNHDMGRVANVVQSNLTDLKMTAGLLLSMNGSPFIYYGEEIGMKSKGKADENKRLHMNWSETDLTGICTDPDGADKDIVQSLPPADAQMEDADSLYSYYKEALAIRNAYPQIARGEIKIIDKLTDSDIAVITKTYDDETIAILYNTGDETAYIDTAGTPLENMKVVGVLDAAGSTEADASASGDDTGGEKGRQTETADEENGLHNITVTLAGRSIVYMK